MAGVTQVNGAGGKAVLEFSRFRVLSFDCYGTLIDWESGLLGALRPVLHEHGVKIETRQLLELYVGLEADLEEGPYRSYREILGLVMDRLGAKLGFQPTPKQRECLVEALPTWVPYPDTVAALRALKSRYRLAVISNIDDSLFAQTARHFLPVQFDWIITAEQVRSYKPSFNNFRFAFEKMGTTPLDQLHVAQSLYHDVMPARAQGMSCVWVTRGQGIELFGATPRAQPDLEVPDLMSLANLALGRS